ncbi:MAG TPA: asparaginase [Gammaproteobacteria bacterium]|nr:asparaginase [Gammaproteobacteria bacterium]
MPIPINNNQSKIHVIALGGTILCMSENQLRENYNSPSINIDKLISLLPLDKKKFSITHEQLLQKISHDITHDDLFLIAKRVDAIANNDEIDGIVIVQGTNSIEETAYFINLVINTKKPIVFTGAFRPYNALGFDGIRNLYNSIILASHKQTSALGAVLIFNDYIVTARDASKSLWGDFSSYGVEVAGFIQGNDIHIQKTGLKKHTYLSEFNINEVKTFPKIHIIYGHLGIDRMFVDTALANNAKGIISAGMGKGYQPKELADALIQASKKGIFVVRCSRTGQGILNRDSKIDDQFGFIAGGSLNPQKAVILLSVALSRTKDRNQIQRIFDEY